MSYHLPNWPHWPTPSHSPEIERRLTENKLHIEYHREYMKDLESDLVRAKKRLSIHEKALLAILAVLQFVLQEKYPSLAQVIKQFLP